MNEDTAKEAAWLRDKSLVEGSATLKAIYMLGLERGIQIERGRALDERVDSVLARIAEVGERGARVF